MTVFEKTRELGDAILQSDEYREMKEAEYKAMNNDFAAKHLTMYIEHKKAITELMSMDMPDQKAIMEQSQILDEIQQQLSMIDEVNYMTDKRQAFADLIGQVNDVLRFIITGEMGEKIESGCHCDDCGNCDEHKFNVH